MTFAGQTLIMVGAMLMLVAGIGVLRLPDVYSRMHASTKAASLGTICALAGTAILLPSGEGALKLGIAILFQLATAPVAAHVIGHAAYKNRVPFWEGTLYDELRDAQDVER